MKNSQKTELNYTHFSPVRILKIRANLWLKRNVQKKKKKKKKRKNTIKSLFNIQYSVQFEMLQKSAMEIFRR